MVTVPLIFGDPLVLKALTSGPHWQYGTDNMPLVTSALIYAFSSLEIQRILLLLI